MSPSDSSSFAQSGAPRTDAVDVLAYWTQQRCRDANPAAPPEYPVVPPSAAEIDTSAAPVETAWSPGPGDPPTIATSSEVGAFATTEINDSTHYPLRTVGKLFFRLDGRDMAASAAVVHRLGILTAAHCVRSSDTGNWATDVVFAPAYDGGFSQYGAWPVGVMFVRNEWLGPPLDPGFDFAFCQMPPRQDVAIGDLVGHLGIVVNQGTTLSWDDLGYPANPIPGFMFNGQRMWDCFGDLSRTGGASILKHGNLTQGASGGPWIVRGDDGGYRANGTFSHLVGYPPAENTSPYFRDVVFDLFRAAFG